METCRTCRFASIVAQECRRNPPVPVTNVGQHGLRTFGVFPPIVTNPGCGAHEPLSPAEQAQRDEEHPITKREIPDPPPGPRLVV